MLPDHQAEPACWSWPIEAAHLQAVAELSEDGARTLLNWWQREKCAVCGAAAAEMILDHGGSGLVRGLLCGRCTTQAESDTPVFNAYRAQPPAVLLGLRPRDPSPGSLMQAESCGPIAEDQLRQTTSKIHFPWLESATAEGGHDAIGVRACTGPHQVGRPPAAGYIQGWCQRDEAEFLARITTDDAIRAYRAFHEDEGHTEAVQKIGRGQNRTAYLIGGIVYKVDGWPPENVHDHQMLQSARQAGMPWAPPSALFELEIGDDRKKHVMAMPYFVNDGSAPDPEAMEVLRAQTNKQVGGANFRLVRGKPVAIDAGDMAKEDLGFCQKPTAVDLVGRPTATCQAPAAVIRFDDGPRLLCAACAATTPLNTFNIVCPVIPPADC